MTKKKLRYMGRVRTISASINLSMNPINFLN